MYRELFLIWKKSILFVETVFEFTNVSFKTPSFEGFQVLVSDHIESTNSGRKNPDTFDFMCNFFRQIMMFQKFPEFVIIIWAKKGL